MQKRFKQLVETRALFHMLFSQFNNSLAFAGLHIANEQALTATKLLFCFLVLRSAVMEKMMTSKKACVPQLLLR